MSASQGGYIRGPWWRYREDEETTRHCFVLAWGNIVREPTDLYKQDLRSIRFVIKTGRGAGRTEKHLVCAAYGDQMSAVVMRAMEKGDIVLVAGTWVEKQTKTKKGVKPIYEMRVNFIIPLGLISFLLELYATPDITSAVEARRNEDADVWESD